MCFDACVTMESRCPNNHSYLVIVCQVYNTTRCHRGMGEPFAVRENYFDLSEEECAQCKSEFDQEAVPRPSKSLVLLKRAETVLATSRANEHKIRDKWSSEDEKKKFIKIHTFHGLAQHEKRVAVIGAGRMPQRTPEEYKEILDNTIDDMWDGNLPSGFEFEERGNRKTWAKGKGKSKKPASESQQTELPGLRRESQPPALATSTGPPHATDQSSIGHGTDSERYSHAAAQNPARQSNYSTGAQESMPPSLPRASQVNRPTNRPANSTLSKDDEKRLKHARRLARGEWEKSATKFAVSINWGTHDQREELVRRFVEQATEFWEAEKNKGKARVILDKFHQETMVRKIMGDITGRRQASNFTPRPPAAGNSSSSGVQGNTVPPRGLQALATGESRVPVTRLPNVPPQYDSPRREEDDTDYENFPISDSSDIKKKRENRAPLVGRGRGAAHGQTPTIPIPQPTTGGRGTTSRRVTHQRFREDSDSDHAGLYDGPNDDPPRRRRRPVPATAGSSPDLMGQSPLSRSADNGLRSRAPTRAGSYDYVDPGAPAFSGRTGLTPFRGNSEDAVWEIDSEYENPRSRQPSLAAGGGSANVTGQPPLSRGRATSNASPKMYEDPGAPPASGISSPTSSDMQRSPRIASQSPAGRGVNSQSRSRAGSNASNSAPPSGPMSRLLAKTSSRDLSTAGSPGRSFVGSPLGQEGNSPQGALRQRSSSIPMRAGTSPLPSTPSGNTPHSRQGTPNLQQTRPVTGAGTGQVTRGAPLGSGNQGPAKKNAKKKDAKKR